MRRNSPHVRIVGILASLLAMAANLLAQDTLAKEKAFIQESNDQGSYTMVLIFGMLVVGAGVLIWRRAKSRIISTPNYEAKQSTYFSNESYDLDMDAEKDLEWLRQVKKKTPKITYGKNAPPTVAPKPKASAEQESLDTKMFQEKMRRMQYTQLPINSFSQLAPAKRYQPLPDSNDSALLNAIEQANEESEPDEAIREVSIRVLAAFQTCNSVEALSQIALYDLSSNLRSKAVSTLADFDHESVFESILLACADPTREVRAAAARGLFRLSFDRAHAWKRLIETDDDFRMTQAARAAIESGIVVKSFDRLINEDVKVAYEAFALVGLLIRAGETTEIFDAIKNHRDERVRFALLHVVKVIKDDRALVKLNELRAKNSFPTEMADRMRDVVNSFDRVTA